MRDVDEIFHVWERTRQSLCIFQGDGDGGDGDGGDNGDEDGDGGDGDGDKGCAGDGRGDCAVDDCEGGRFLFGDDSVVLMSSSF